ncbi:translocation protein sec63 [Collybia nuda]|uniref:Translocation protein sec63 n=1 Tax=Collybia nuda TaxID=64659 RepID=A0A9P6CQ85_9AGAR|nr:translocation protein sec63 [Collybia nuda]
MAQYHYDEGGNMAAYFLITFLSLILIPMTLSLFNSSTEKTLDGCQCKPCVDHRKRVGSLLKPNFSRKTYFLVAGWSVLGYVAYRAATAKIDNKVYNPFEILGIKSGTTEKEIKSHYKKLSRMYHPDKVRATVNNTIEEIQNRFVEITKAYKSLTDETIRENLEKYGHPDGRQDVSMGIALPKWIVERENNIWVLGVYGLLIGGALPALVGRWWFGSRQKTKDGVNARSAAAFFKSLKEESTMEEVISTFGKAYQWELPVKTPKYDADLDRLEKQINEQAGSKWEEVRTLCGDNNSRRKALVLIYAHLLRISIENSTLQEEQTKTLLQTPILLSALLNISISRSWLLPTLAIMRLHAYLAQALIPGSDHLRFAQLPGISTAEVDTLAHEARDLGDILSALEKKSDSRALDVKKALQKWGRIEIVDAAFKVIGERVVTPSSIVFLVVKLRLSPPDKVHSVKEELDANNTKRVIKMNDEKDEEFLTSRKEVEEMSDDFVGGLAHAPYWPGERKPSWWVVLSDEKTNRVVVPPMRITDVPFSQPTSDRNYRCYKIQFQAPQGTGVFTWKVQVISDTFVGEDVSRDISLKIEDASVLNTEEPLEDDISDPDEDTIAGQMAAMRGGAVKKHTVDDDESDDESSTDDDKGSSSSDSDSD